MNTVAIPTGRPGSSKKRPGPPTENDTQASSFGSRRREGSPGTHITHRKKPRGRACEEENSTLDGYRLDQVERGHGTGDAKQ